MSDVVPILRDPGRRHWVKCILGLDELGIAILPHIKDLFRNYYDRHFWDYHHLGCTLDCKHDHFYHLGPGPSEPCMCCLNNASTNHAHHQIENENFHESLYSNDYEHNEPTQCNLKQSVQFPEGFADWKLSKRLGYDSCYHYITCIKKDCKHDNCSCRKVFNDLVKKHKNMHGQDGCCHVKKRGKDWFLETKPECTACESAFDLLKKLFVNTEKIYWRNINFPEDFRDSWQLTKAFMPSGNTNIDDPTKADPVALLTVMNNCLLFEDVKPNLVDKIISKRNGFIHIGSKKSSTTTEQTDAFFDLIIEFLEDKYDCQENIATIKKLRDSEVTAQMFTKAIAIHVQCLLNTLSNYNSAGEDISKLVNDLECSIKDKVELEKYQNNEQEVKKSTIGELRIENTMIKQENRDLKMKLTKLELQIANQGENEKCPHLCTCS